MKLFRCVAPTAIALFVSACAQSTPDAPNVGYVEAEYVYVAAPQSGWIEQLTAVEGDRVDFGQVLFELDKDREWAMHEEAKGRVLQADAQARDLGSGARPAEIASLEAQLRDAEAQLVFAQAELERSLPLVDDGIVAAVTGDRLIANRDRAQAQVSAAEEAIRVARLAGREAAQEAAAAAKDVANSALVQAQWNVAQRTINARRSGRVEQIFYRQGEFVAAGAPVIALLPDDSLKVRVFVSQADLPRLRVGGALQVASDGLATPVEARISFIAGEAEFTPPVIYSAESREKLVFLVEARLPAGTSLHPGLPVDVQLP